MKRFLDKESEEETVEKSIPKVSTIRYEKKEMDKFLNNLVSFELLRSYNLGLPSTYKDVSLKEIQKALDKGLELEADLESKIKNTARFAKDSLSGLVLAYPVKKGGFPETLKKIQNYNIIKYFNNNMGKLRNYKQLSGTGIIHFNNPLQLIDRLELLAGSIFAGNNGVKQEFSQIAHLLHQLKVITKKPLNDLLKKYILNK